MGHEQRGGAEFEKDGDPFASPGSVEATVEGRDNEVTENARSDWAG